MKITRIAALVFVSGFCLLSAEKSFAQSGNGAIVQDSRFEQLLADKRKINSSITVNDKYKIQIFYGDNEKARKTLSEFRREYKNIDGTIIFASPTYKVWVGSFKSRIDAERTLKDIQRKYPYALLIKPNK
ncbi:MAG: SPOR domain-containing protein [Flavobacterium sp.]